MSESSLGGGERGESALRGGVRGNSQSGDKWRRALRSAGVGFEVEKGPDCVCESVGSSDCSGRHRVGVGEDDAGLCEGEVEAGQARLYA